MRDEGEYIRDHILFAAFMGWLMGFATVGIMTYFTMYAIPPGLAACCVWSLAWGAWGVRSLLRSGSGGTISVKK